MSKAGHTVTQAPPEVIVVMGPPASGKTTVAQRLAKRLGFVHVSTGDLFRSATKLAQGDNALPELGVAAKPFLDRGCFVPDDVVFGLVEQLLVRRDVVAAGGLLIDGFPRTEDQARMLIAKAGKTIRLGSVLLLDVPDRILVKRAPGRRVDPVTGSIYNTLYVKPPNAVIAARLATRDRDTGRAFKVRLDVHHETMRRVLPVLKAAKGVRVSSLSGMQTPSEVEAAALRCLASARAAAAADGAREAAQAKKEMAAGGTCVICMDKKAEYACVPCGHQSGCEACLKRCRKCPICRTPIRSLLKIFSDAAGGGGAAAALKDEDEEIVPHAGFILDAGVDGVDEWPRPPPLDDEEEEDNDDDTSDESDDDDAAAAVPGLQLHIAPATDLNIKMLDGADSATVDVCVTIKVPPSPLVEEKRTPVDVCCVVDTSGSMQRSAQSKEDGDQGNADNAGDGLSILDIVKHAVKTVAHTLGPRDRLSVIAFSSAATIALPLTEVATAAGRKAMTEAVEGLRAKGQTNLWAGLKLGMDSLVVDAKAGDGESVGDRKKAVLLLTDGQPNVEPPRGHLVELGNYKDQHPGFEFQLNSFGFGYSLDSELLLDLASAGHGTFAFIPDAVIVGTTFVNCISNIVATRTQAATLHLSAQHGTTFATAATAEASRDYGGHASTDEDWGRVLAIGPIQHGQDRRVAVALKIPASLLRQGPSRVRGQGREATAYLEATLTIPQQTADGRKTLRVTALGSSLRATTDARVGAARARVASAGFKAVRDVGRKAARIRKAARSLAAVARHIDELRRDDKDDQGEGGGDCAELAALHADVSGRMTKALLGHDRFKRWGRHYLRAISRAHSVEVCTNFMDAGLQLLGGPVFRRLRAKGDAAFLALPPPQPVNPLEGVPAHLLRAAGLAAAPRARRARGGAAAAAAAAAPRARAPAPRPQPRMQTYYAGSGGGCFDPRATVLKISKSSVGKGKGRARATRIKDLRPGDQVRVASDGTATVRFVVALSTNKPLVRLKPGPDQAQGLRITSTHPIRVDGQWTLPTSQPHTDLLGKNTSTSSRDDDDEVVYNVVLDNSHVLLVDGVECITWGHGLADAAAAAGEDPESLLAHDFYGTESIVDVLRSQRRASSFEFSESGGWWPGIDAVEDNDVLRVAGCYRSVETGKVVGFRWA